MPVKAFLATLVAGTYSAKEILMCVGVALLAAAFIALGTIFVVDILTFDKSDDLPGKQDVLRQEQIIGQRTN